MKSYRKFLLFILITFALSIKVYPYQNVKVGIIKYRGGDWYSCIKGVKNFLNHLTIKTPIKCAQNPVVINPAKSELFKYPFVIINGHGKILLNNIEKVMIKKYLLNGGFLLANDDFGMDKHFKKLIKELFPGNKLIPLPIEHSIFKSFYKFKSIPKIHKHSGKKPVFYGLFINKRLSVLYIYESDIIDGWEKPGVHNLPLIKRQTAIKFGINIFYYVLSG